MSQNENIILAGGCFWCMEAVFSRVRGVSSAVAGYVGGNVLNPTYEQVCAGKTGHAEAIRIEFDAGIIPLEDILRIFFTVHDPTTLNKQDSDIGTQYRSAIFYSSDDQKKMADKIIREIEGQHVYDDEIVTEVKPLEKFYPAEERHQHYFAKNSEAGYCQIVIAPKVGKFREKFQKFYV